MPNARVLGVCYVCDKLVWGVTLRHGRPYATSNHARYAVEDGEGVRHSTCYPSDDGSSSQVVNSLYQGG